MVRCRLGGNGSRSTRCLAATKGRLGGGHGAAGHASERGLLTPADIPLRIPSACVTRSVHPPLPADSGTPHLAGSARWPRGLAVVEAGALGVLGRRRMERNSGRGEQPETRTQALSQRHNN